MPLKCHLDQFLSKASPTNFHKIFAASSNTWPPPRDTIPAMTDEQQQMVRRILLMLPDKVSEARAVVDEVKRRLDATYPSPELLAAARAIRGMFDDQ